MENIKKKIAVAILIRIRLGVTGCYMWSSSMCLPDVNPEHICWQKGFDKLIPIENCIGVSLMPLVHTKVAYFVHMGHLWSRWIIVRI